MAKIQARFNVADFTHIGTAFSGIAALELCTSIAKILALWAQYQGSVIKVIILTTTKPAIARCCTCGGQTGEKTRISAAP